MRHLRAQSVANQDSASRLEGENSSVGQHCAPARLRKRYDVAAAEAGHVELHRRSLVGIAVVATEAAHCVEVLDACERLVASRPEVELLSARRQFVSEEDE